MAHLGNIDCRGLHGSKKTFTLGVILGRKASSLGVQPFHPGAGFLVSAVIF